MKPQMSKNKHVQLTWTDLANITRCHVVTRDMYERHFRNNGASMTICIMSLPCVGPPVEPGMPLVTFQPDTDAPPLPLQAWLPNGELAFGRIFDDSGAPSASCARTFLAKQESLLLQADISVTVGFELEFFLLNDDNSLLDKRSYSESRALQGASWKILTEVVDVLTQDFDIPVWRYHHEVAASQYEISIGPFPAIGSNSLLHAADSLVLARQAIYNISAKHGKKATFLPKPFPGLASGAHVHVSLERNSRNLFQENLEDGQSFLGGILENLPSLAAVLTPTGNSYDRLQPSAWCGAFQCIGTDNREAAIRLMRNNGGVVSRFEVKSIDGTANPYLMLGGLVGAGLRGLRERTPLPQETNVDPMSLPLEKRPPRLPSSLEEAISAFRESEAIRELFGEEMHRLIIGIRSAEKKYWESDTETLENKMKYLMETY